MLYQDKFVGERIYLRILDVEDANEVYCGWINDPEVNKFLATKSATVQELKKYIIQKREKSDALFFGIFLKIDDKFIGTIKLEPIEPQEKRATIALMIGDKNYWGKGIAGEAMKLLIDYCFNELGFSAVNLGVIGQNTNAVKLYLKLGFVIAETISQSVNYGGILYDQVNMTLKNRVSN